MGETGFGGPDVSASVVGGAGGARGSVELDGLIRHCARVSYKDLHRILDSMSELDDRGRKKMLLDYVQQTRHRLLRLLVAVRWAGEFGQYTQACVEAVETAKRQGVFYESAADALWSVHQNMLTAPLAKYAVGPAIDILTTGSFPRLPKIIPSSVGIILSPDDEGSHFEGALDHSGSSRRVNEAYVMQRLGAATRGAVQASLPGLSGIQVMRWRCGENSACVAVGLPHAWRAEISLDSLDMKRSIFRVHRVQVLVAPSPESVALRTSKRYPTRSVTIPQEALLRRLADDRVIAVARNYDNTFNSKGGNEEIVRPRILLEALRDLLSREFCVPFAMEILKSQAEVLSLTCQHKSMTCEVDKDGQIHVTYWKGSPSEAKMSISAGSVDGQGEMDLSDPELLISIGHDPPLLHLSRHCLHLDSLDLEEILIAGMQSRARARLQAIAEDLHRQPELQLRKEDMCVASVGQHISLVILLREGNALCFSTSLRTGGLMGKPVGAILGYLEEGGIGDAGLWEGDKVFGSLVAEGAAVSRAIVRVRRRIQLESASRAMCVLDVGVTRSLPPGTPSVMGSNQKPSSQLVPPFAQLERKAPRRFLTLSPPTERSEEPSLTSTGAGTDRVAKRQRLTYATTNDNLVFIQENSNLESCGRVDRYSGSAAAALTWAVAREVVERRLRRDSLVRAFLAANVAVSTSQSTVYDDGDQDVCSASKKDIKVKCEPLPVRRAEVLLRGNDAWQVRLTLLPVIFDSTDHADTEEASNYPIDNPWSYGVNCKGSVLTFTYPFANAPSVTKFFMDLTRARTAAAFSRSLPPASMYKVIQRSPIRLVAAICPATTSDSGNGETRRRASYTATVEYVYTRANQGGFSVSFRPSRPTMDQLAPYIEEVLDASAGAIGSILAGLLERACPVAAAVESAVRERALGRVRFVTALRMRVVFFGVPQNASRQRHPQAPTVAHAFDVDARGGGGTANVIDVGRASAGMVSQGFAHRGQGSEGRGRDYTPLPRWDTIVAAFVGQDFARSAVGGSTVTLQIEVLERFLTTLVNAARPGQGGMANGAQAHPSQHRGV